MKTYSICWIVASLVMLSACSGSNRPVYSGHQESTEGVPGFSGGKKLTPYVKLGQSYTVAGETYVPRHQPDYVEEGLASWYGPGFHGGKTANGERFDKHEMTGAHRTLPLPSMVRVTLLETGKTAIVRINDRGPFSKNRIIDLSYAAAQQIGLIGKGVARVRVEYLPQESQKFAELLSVGRDPKSIDIESEVLAQMPSAYAASSTSVPDNATVTAAPSWRERLSPISKAHAETITVADLTAPASAAPKTTTPFDVMQEASAAPVALPHYIQLGAFSDPINAERLQVKAAHLGGAHIEQKTQPDATILYVVRMGPYSGVEESSTVLAQLTNLGIHPKRITK